jgi:hypothetical protein
MTLENITTNIQALKTMANIANKELNGEKVSLKERDQEIKSNSIINTEIFQDKVVKLYQTQKSLKNIVDINLDNFIQWYNNNKGHTLCSS